METNDKETLCLVNEITSNKKKVQWKHLPDDIWNLVFLEYCDFLSLVNSRILQTEYVKECTKGNNMFLAIQASNFKNMNWIHEFDKQFQWSSVYFTEAANCDGNNMEVLEWLRINNCPWDDYTFFKNMIKQPAVHEWLLNHAMTLN